MLAPARGRDQSITRDLLNAGCRVHVLVLNFNDSRWLDRCLGSLFATSYNNAEIVLIDNGSTDGSLPAAEQRFADLRIVRNDGNLGFCKGNNAGILRALESGADLIVLLNPDTWVEPDWLGEIVRVAQEEPQAGIFGPVQLVYEGNEFNEWTLTALSPHLSELRDPLRARDRIPVECVEGSCFAVRRKVFEEIGLLDPIYFAFYEEIDFCRRAAYRGWRTLLLPQSRIHHFRGGWWRANPEVERRRNFNSDLSQFIYNLTDPSRTLGSNLAWYLITLATKTKGVVKARRADLGWDLLRIQGRLVGQIPAIVKKWRLDRALSLGTSSRMSSRGF